MYLSSDIDWGLVDDDFTRARCNLSRSCSVWLFVGQIEDSDVDFISKLDREIDKSDGGTKGKVRWINHSIYKNQLFYKMFATEPYVD